MEYSEGFARFWSAWPSNQWKTSKSLCYEIWRARGLEDMADHICSIVEAKKKTKGWNDGYIPKPKNWLNDKEYDCDVADIIPPKRQLNVGLPTVAEIRAREEAQFEEWKKRMA
jgi:hypothetical protein